MSIASAVTTALRTGAEAATERARAFTWEKAAAATLAIYEEIVPTARRRESAARQFRTVLELPRADR